MHCERIFLNDNSRRVRTSTLDGFTGKTIRQRKIKLGMIMPVVVQGYRQKDFTNNHLIRGLAFTLGHSAVKTIGEMKIELIFFKIH